MRSRLADLLDRTERNIKRIEAVQGDFPAVALNEWRYATRHVVSLLEGDGGEEERRKAEDHIARAYFDSCDILLDCLLERARVHLATYSAFPEIPASSVADYPRVLRTIRDAHRLHGETQGFTVAEKAARYAELEAVIGSLSEAVDALDVAGPTMSSALRRERRKDRMTAWGFVATLLGLVLAALALFK